jgi:hypothetical protein
LIIEDGLPPDLHCPHCGKRRISKIEISHSDGLVGIETCCDDKGCLKKMINGRPNYLVGRIYTINSSLATAISISNSDRDQILRRYPSLINIIKPAKRESVRPKRNNLKATHAYYSQPQE